MSQHTPYNMGRYFMSTCKYFHKPNASEKLSVREMPSPYVTRFVKIGLNAASNVFFFLFSPTGRLHWVLGCCPPNLEAVAQAIFALRTATLQYYCSICYC